MKENPKRNLLRRVYTYFLNIWTSCISCTFEPDELRKKYPDALFYD